MRLEVLQIGGRAGTDTTIGPAGMRDLPYGVRLIASEFCRVDMGNRSQELGLEMVVPNENSILSK